jgi:predicted metal-dependent hydrolase
MSKSSFEVPEIGTVFITKKRGQRTMRLRVDTKGSVQVSMPWMVPAGAAKDFVISKRDWIQQQQSHISFSPYDGMLLGKTLQLKIIENSQQVRSTQTGRTITVPFAGDYDSTNPDHLEKIKKAITKALRTEAEKVLLPRLRELAELYGFEYQSAAIKQLVGRWGSCDSTRHIALSLYLIQLPIELIDYVLIHELTHTVHLNHSPGFWSDVQQLCPDYKQLRRKMRELQPRIYDAKTFMA